MVTLYVGPKGSGKTKLFVETANQAADQSKGIVVCVEKGSISTFRVKHSIRLVDTDIYGITNYQQLNGLIAGLCAGNYDITDILVDATLRIGGRKYEELCAFVQKISTLSQRTSIDVTMTISAHAEDLPEELARWAKIKNIGAVCANA